MLDFFSVILPKNECVLVVFVAPILFLIVWILIRLINLRYVPKSKNIIKKFLLIDIKNFIPRNLFVVNSINLIVVILIILAFIIHIILFTNVTSGIFRILLAVYLITTFIYSLLAFKYYKK